MSFTLTGKPYTYPDFIDHVKEWQGRTGQDLRIVCYVSNLGTEELLDSLKKHGSKIRQMGDVFEVVAEYFMDQKRWYATFYCYYDEKRRALLAFTSSSAEEVDRTLDDWVRHQPNVYYLWINPRLITDIEARIINDHPDTIIPAFTAKRFPWSKFSKVIRPDFERSFQYHGDDGRFTLEELENYYGVLPTSIDFAVPRAAHFRMTDNGLFTFKSGNLDFVFDVINQALSGALKEREIIQEARYEFIPLTSGRKQLQVLNVVPLSMSLSKPISYDDAGLIIDALGSSGFEVYDVIKESGSLHLGASIYDKQNKTTVDLTGTSKRLTLTPHGDVPFDSFMRIYRALADKVDVETSVGPLA